MWFYCWFSYRGQLFSRLYHWLIPELSSTEGRRSMNKMGKWAQSKESILLRDKMQQREGGWDGWWLPDSTPAKQQQTAAHSASKNSWMKTVSITTPGPLCPAAISLLEHQWQDMNLYRAAQTLYNAQASDFLNQSLLVFVHLISLRSLDFLWNFLFSSNLQSFF